MIRSYLQLLRSEPPILLFGLLCAFLSSPGQTFFIALFVGSLGESASLSAAHITTDFGELSERAVYLRGLRYLLLCCAYVGIAWAIGILPAIPLFILLYMTWMGESSRLSLPVAAAAAIAAYLLFHGLLRLAWPVPLWDVVGRLGLFG